MDPTNQRNCSFYCRLKWCVTGVVYYIVLGFAAFGYYVFVILVWGPKLWENFIPSALVILGFHFFWVLFLISLMRSVFCDPGSVPRLEESGTPSTNERSRTDRQRYCTKCQNIKPDRAHHCSICNRCVLKMDHHCPWVNNCVGWRNYKFFMLFLFYTDLLTIYTFALLLPHFVGVGFAKMGPREIMTLVLMFLAVTFGLTVMCFTFTHLHLIFNNMTTIEYYEKSRSGSTNPYDLGSARKNWEQVFGTKPLLWFVPIRTSIGNGLSFPRNDTAVFPPAPTDQPFPQQQLSNEEISLLKGVHTE
jgi:hypothetical protein